VSKTLGEGALEKYDSHPPCARFPPLRPSADPRTIIHVWLSSATLLDVVSNGYRGIYSTDGLYYLDDLTETAASFYNVDILGGINNVTQQQLVLGGEVEMWGETVDG
jgi:hexosaminidase